MSGTAARNKMFEAASPVTVAILIADRLLDAYPFEITRRGRAVLRSHPPQNQYRLALLGQGELGGRRELVLTTTQG